MKVRQASCCCGQLQVHTTGEPVRISMCHCRECQKRTGSIFGVQARFHEDQVRIQGESKVFVRIADSGHRVCMSFCHHCGSTVFYTLDVLPGSIGVAVGAFADPGFPEPEFSVYEARRHAWAGIPREAKRME